VNAAYEDASKKIAEAEELEKQKERMIQKADTITASWSGCAGRFLLGELTRIRPENVNFVSLELKSRESRPGRQAQSRPGQGPAAPWMDWRRTPGRPPWT